MKKTKLASLVAIVILLAILLTLGTASLVAAAPGGMPRAHCVDGKAFGALVSELAQSAPGAVAEHVTGK